MLQSRGTFYEKILLWKYARHPLHCPRREWCKTDLKMLQNTEIWGGGDNNLERKSHNGVMISHSNNKGTSAYLSGVSQLGFLPATPLSGCGDIGFILLQLLWKNADLAGQSKLKIFPCILRNIVRHKRAKSDTFLYRLFILHKITPCKCRRVVNFHKAIKDGETHCERSEWNNLDWCQSFNKIVFVQHCLVIIIILHSSNFNVL